MRCHLSGTSPKAKKCQFSLGSEPLWAWLCAVLGRQDAIEELFLCVLARQKSSKTKAAAQCGPPPVKHVGLGQTAFLRLLIVGDAVD